ncbi:dTDP-4-dehydrorhamnose reductase [Elioraea sp.]|uniref:dTDP-4-dehydrorhamnose reductase n=1 Tax=Elioraea sp. TaxID=2185103 RepID=UPI0025C233E0|nr:dTDP-4-dehydrorhamnose reductase [Elioraea sp.]
MPASPQHGPRIVVLGGTGQLGAALARAGGPDVRALSRAAADVTDAAALRSALVAARADIVINAAAYTAVDRAESEPGPCFAVNRDGAGNAASVCAALGIPLVHLSTDYVFDGRKGAPYLENDARNPLNAYGAAKAAGEDLVLARHERAIILRTAWLFGLDRPNFVRTVMRLALAGRPLRFVADQHGSPTPAPGLARVVLAMAARLHEGTARGGIVHAAGAPHATWHDVASSAVAAVFPAWQRPPVAAITTDAYPTPARRPADTRIDCTRLRTEHGIEVPDWVRALPRLAAALAAQEADRLRSEAASEVSARPSLQPAPALHAGE